MKHTPPITTTTLQESQLLQEASLGVQVLLPEGYLETLVASLGIQGYSHFIDKKPEVLTGKELDQDHTTRRTTFWSA